MSICMWRTCLKRPGICGTTYSRFLAMATRNSSDIADLQSGRGGSIKVQFASDVAVITMDRGENRMNDEFIDQMNAALDEALRNPTLKAIITTGAEGSKFYSNGLDLHWLGALSKTDPGYVNQALTRGFMAMKRLLTFPVLTVAAINGHAFAGGAAFSLCHDVRVMQNQRGFWCVNMADVGGRLPQWNINLCRLKLGGHGARGAIETTAFGKRFTAEEARDRGIVHEICPVSELLSTARSCVDAVLRDGAVGRSFVEKTKEQLYEDVLKNDAFAESADYDQLKFHKK